MELAAHGCLIRHCIDCNLFFAAIKHLHIIGNYHLHLFLYIEHLAEGLCHGDAGV